MSIYFGFSDENGHYQQYRDSDYTKIHPFYIRSTLIIVADEWRKIREEFSDLKELYGLPKEREIKWAYLWSLRNYKKKDQNIPSDKDFKFLEDYDYHDLISFVDSSLSLINRLSYKKIVISFTNNSSCVAINEKALLKMHLQEHMQRLEMEIQTRENTNLAVLFFDPVSKETDQHLRDVYFDLYNSGDFISKYNHIKDSLNIENSHQSVGIQLADYISGAFSSMLKGIGSDNYKMGKEMYFDYVLPNLRSMNSVIWGYGLREVPSDMVYRKGLKIKFDNEKIRINK